MEENVDCSLADDSVVFESLTDETGVEEGAVNPVTLEGKVSSEATAFERVFDLDFFSAGSLDLKETDRLPEEVAEIEMSDSIVSDVARTTRL